MAELNLSQIEEKLNSEFRGEGRRLVFWYDDKGDFADEVDNLKLQNAKIYHLTKSNQFRTKELLEREDTESNYLLYAPFPKPEVYENHLEDTLLYSKRFYADRISLICADLGIDEALKPVLEQYSKYFAAKERLQRFYSIGVDKYDEKTILLALICCICKTRTLSFEEALGKILLVDDLAQNPYLDELEKYNLVSAFWQQCTDTFGYPLVDKSLEKLVIALFVTYVDKYLGADVPVSWEPFLCNKQGSVVVFLDGFMNNVQCRDRFDALAKFASDKLQADSAMASMGAEAVLHVDAFLASDKVIIQWLVERLMLEDLSATLDGKNIREICALRSKMHYANVTSNQYKLCASAYEVIKAVQYQPLKDFDAVLDRYLKEDWQIDYWYRQFYYCFDKANNASGFARLQQLVENVYANEYLAKLLPAWNEGVVEAIEKKVIPFQKDFYNRYIRNERDKVVVIISDALRYEVAKELESKLQQEERCKAKRLDMQLSVLPSYTALGMAALLPHKKLEMSADCKVVTNGRRCASLDERAKILQEANPASMCIQFDDLKNLKRDELRSIFVNKQVIYIYHNQIDARGDAAKTEDEVFVACYEAVDELYKMLCRLPVSARVSNFIVTSDHGFIYQRHPIAENEKLAVSGTNGYVNHRFVIGEQPQGKGTGAIHLGTILGNDDERVVAYPKGGQVFKTAGGGTNYVHGGSSPQEMIVPVLRVKMDRGHVETHNAAIKLHTQINKITSKDINLVFLQTEPVSEICKAASYKLSFVDESNRAITNEYMLAADSSATELSQRMITARFSFINREYDSHAAYYLVIRDADTDVEVERCNFVIDMPFMGDFGFDF